MPFLMRSWSPLAQPDIIIESEKRAHLSSIGLVSISPIRHDMRFFTTTFPGSAKSAEMSYVLDERHNHFRRKVIIVWDNLQGHKGLETKYLREHPDWFHFERLPTYCPTQKSLSQASEPGESSTGFNRSITVAALIVGPNIDETGNTHRNSMSSNNVGTKQKMLAWPTSPRKIKTKSLSKSNLQRKQSTKTKISFLRSSNIQNSSWE